MSDEKPQIVIFDTNNFPSIYPSSVLISHSDIEGGEEEILIAPDSDSFFDYIHNGIPIDPNLIDPNMLTWGEGNIDLDPNYVRLGYLHDNNTPGDVLDDFWVEGDYHLMSQAGRYEWNGFSEADFDFDKSVDLVDFSIIAQWWNKDIHNYPSQYYLDIDGNYIINEVELLAFLEDYLQPRVFGAWVVDDVTSPCIDAGDPNDLDWQNELWPHGGRINMGAYGGTPQASLSPSVVGNPADLNHDDAVDLADWSLWVDDWLDERVLLDSDFNRNNIVDPNDMTIFMTNWLWTP